MIRSLVRFWQRAFLFAVLQFFLSLTCVWVPVVVVVVVVVFDSGRGHSDFFFGQLVGQLLLAQAVAAIFFARASLFLFPGWYSINFW